MWPNYFAQANDPLKLKRAQEIIFKPGLCDQRKTCLEKDKSSPHNEHFWPKIFFSLGEKYLAKNAPPTTAAISFVCFESNMVQSHF